MDAIPITFEYKERVYSGYFNPVFGAGTDVWYLMINNFYCGRLRLTEHYGWVFDANDFRAEELTDFFGDYVMAWQQ